MFSSIFSLEKCLYRAIRIKNKHSRLASLIEFWYDLIHSCDIPCATSFGAGVRFPHRGIGVVINKQAIIGDDCVIFQNVTIGGRGGAHDNAQPVIGNNVMIGCGAVIIGGVHIGDGAIIGANAVVLNDVPAGVTAVGIPARNLKSKI